MNKINTINTINAANKIDAGSKRNTTEKICTTNEISKINMTNKINISDEMAGLSQEEIQRLENMQPELKNALLRLRKNIRARQLENEQAAISRETNRLLGIKTPEEAAEERSVTNLRLAMAEQEKRSKEAVRKKYLTDSGMQEAGIPLAFRTATMESILRRGIPEQLEYIQMRLGDYTANIEKCCQLVMSLLDRLEKSNHEEYSRTMRKLCTVPLLVLDNMGAEGRHADFVRSKLEQIIFQRHANNKSIIITTNLTQNAMAGMYTSRIMDRLRERCLVLEHKGSSLRQQSLFSLTSPDPHDAHDALNTKLPTTSSTGGLLSALKRAIIAARPEGRCRKQYY